MSRAAHIKDVLDHHFMVECEQAVATPDAATWRSIEEGLGPQAQFGWSGPVTNGQPRFLVPYCPEIIDEQTAHLDDDELRDYLDVIEWVAMTHILLWDKIPDPVERNRVIEDELEEKYPGTLTVWNEVRLSILDRTLC